MASRSLVVGIVGAGTAAGREIGTALAERSFPVGELRLFDAGEAAGEVIEIGEEELTIASLEKASLRGCDLIFIAPEEAGAEPGFDVVEAARETGAVVIDAGRLHRPGDGTLIFPGINDEDLEEAKGRHFSLPSPAAAQLAAALLPLDTKVGVTRAEVVCLEATSGAGIPGMEELSMQTVSLLNGRDPERGVFPHRIAFNLIPQAGAFEADGVAAGEKRIEAELEALMGRPMQALTITCVQVPVFYGSTQIVHLATERPLDAPAAREALAGGEGIKILDDAAEGVYPMPILSVGDESVLIGRIRETKAGLSLLSVADGLRWGTVVPMVRIAELLRDLELL